MGYQAGPIRLNDEIWAGYRHEYLQNQYLLKPIEPAVFEAILREAAEEAP
jgi:hypothetical protein